MLLCVFVFPFLIAFSVPCAAAGESVLMRINKPVDGDAIFSKTVSVVGRVADSVVLKKLEVNGRELVIPDIPGFTFSVEVELEQGPNEIRVVAVGADGAVQSETLTVTREDTTPQIDVKVSAGTDAGGRNTAVVEAVLWGKFSDFTSVYFDEEGIDVPRGSKIFYVARTVPYDRKTVNILCGDAAGEAASWRVDLETGEVIALTVGDKALQSHLIEATEGKYLIQNNDQLEIAVFGVDELTKSVLVRPDGFISFPLIGELKVAGKTPEQVRKELDEILPNYVVEPKVSVIVLRFQMPKVYVFGEVSSPGVHEITDPYGLAGIVAKAGLKSGDILGQKVLVVRNGKPYRELRISSGQDSIESFEILDRDIVYVPESFVSQVYVVGGVKKPGGYGLPYDRKDVGMLLSRSAAANPEVYNGEVEIIRGGEKMKVRLDRGMAEVELNDGDIVHVPVLKGDIITVTGEVNRPGVLDFKSDYNISDLIYYAGGPTRDARLTGVEIIRGEPGSVERIVVGSAIASDGGRDVELMAGDIVYVPGRRKSFRNSIMKFLPPLRDFAIIKDVFEN